MLRPMSLYTLVAGALLALAETAFTAVPAVPQQNRSGWVTLFDGKSLDGWIIEPATQASQFRVIDGALHVDGSPQGGWLHTPGKYGDFTLKYDVRYVSADHTGNTGILLRSPETSKFGRNWPGGGFEMESRDMNRPSSTLPPEGTLLGLPPGAPLGRLVFDLEAAKRAYRPTGQWNSAEIIAHGNRIWTRLNGEWLSTTYNAAHPDGHLGLQSEDGSAEFRNIRILVHDSSTVTPDRYVTLFDGSAMQGLVVDDARFSSHAVVAHGLLHLEGNGGWLRTISRYTHYTLRMEFRLLTEDADGGVYLRAPSGQNDGSGWPQVATEAQLRSLRNPLPTAAAGDPRWIGAILYRGGTGGAASIDTSAVVSAYRPLGEWQEALIEVQGRNVRYWLNGQLIGEGDNVAHAAGGHVGLQMGPGAIDFRRIEIKGYSLD